MLSVRQVGVLGVYLTLCDRGGVLGVYLTLSPVLQVMLSVRQVGVLGVYLTLAHVLAERRWGSLRRLGEVCLGLGLLGQVYLLNATPHYTTAFLALTLGGHWLRYLLALSLVACALSFFSGHFQRDMALCAAATLALTTASVDLHLHYWAGMGVHRWSVIRQVLNGSCTIVGLLFLSFTVDNKLKAQ